jgi:hypothetical protein
MTVREQARRGHGFGATFRASSEASMARSRSLVSSGSILCLALLGCSATHLAIGEDDAGPSRMDASPGTEAGVARIDAGVGPGLDAWSPTTTTPDAWSPTTTTPDAWSPTTTTPDAWSPTTTTPDAWSPTTTTPDAWSPTTTTPDAWSAPLSDAGPPGVVCGAEVCTAPQICCVAFGGGTATRTCTAPADCMGVAASCDGPEDCAAGEACCGMRSTGGASTGCVPDAMCRFGRLCHADSDCTGRDTCCTIMGASVCSPFCP